MHQERRVRLSKFLSLILRHRPDQVGLPLDPLGRLSLDALTEALRANGWEDLERGEIEEMARLDGRRFDLTGETIRYDIATIFARRAHDRGLPFYQATDRLYLVAQVPVEFLCLSLAGPGA
ncbi:MAG TPA: RNA 2'-phosphotransferase [bacterium]|jgi:RNA:NAD 2'-phosphotransferase (TPT1/KptA family)|nr:RNA 2'-phosphotransferase [bacterium]